MGCSAQVPAQPPSLGRGAVALGLAVLLFLPYAAPVKPSTIQVPPGEGRKADLAL